MPTYPHTPALEQTDVLHGEEIADPYRWLEDGSNPETIRWTAQQNALTEAHLAAIPARERIRGRLQQLLAIGVLSAPTPVRGRYFYLRRDGIQNQPVLYWRNGVDGSDRVAVDPNALNEAGTTALEWFFPSKDGRFLAYGLSDNGSEESVLHVASTTRGIPRRVRCPPVRSSTTGPSTFIV